MNYNRLEAIASALKNSRQNGKSFHVTFIYHGNKLLSIGTNDYEKRHRSLRFGEYKPTRGDARGYTAGIHSEIDAAIKLGISDCRHLKFVNIRIDNNGKPAISRPCANCQRVLKTQLGFKELHYFDGENYVKEKLEK